MFSVFLLAHDSLDCHLIWHLRVVLEAVGVFSFDNLHAP